MEVISEPHRSNQVHREGECSAVRLASRELDGMDCGCQACQFFLVSSRSGAIVSCWSTFKLRSGVAFTAFSEVSECVEIVEGV